MPVFAGCLGRILFRDSIRLTSVAGYIFIIGGLCALVYAGVLAGTAVSIAGIVALALAAFMWADYAVKFRLSGLTAIQAAALISLWSTVLTLPPYIAFSMSGFRHATTGHFSLRRVDCLMRSFLSTPAKVNSMSLRSERLIQTGKCQRLLILTAQAEPRYVYSIRPRSSSTWQRRVRCSSARRRTDQSCFRGYSSSAAAWDRFLARLSTFNMRLLNGLNMQ
ncbi:membrane hypothetical protein [Paraburkholderia caribensis]|nr:membrane hypothetical protein [Paraburkholderia caribensis]